MRLRILIVLLNLGLFSSSPFSPSENPTIYAVNSINFPGEIFPFEAGANKIPASRVHHTVAYSGEFLIVYGGYASDGSVLGDINLYHIESQRWSGPILNKQCCNTVGSEIEISGLENSLSKASDSFSFVRPGFEGDFPYPRGEHAVTVLNNKMYLFGGATKDFDIMQDFYSFDPTALLWSPLNKVSGGIPSRRSGHSMISDVNINIIYLFGGKGSRRTSSSVYFGLNDVWSYNPAINKWKEHVPVSSSSAPSGRQYAACATYYRDLFMFGGIDPSSRKTFNDLWVFRMGEARWELLFKASTGVTGLFPPPLFHSTMIAMANGSISSNGRSSTGGVSLLIYGGVGGGGGCGDAPCRPHESILGQVYSFSLPVSSSRHPVSLTGLGDPLSTELSAIDAISSPGSWQYARLSTSYPASPELSDTGKVIKSFALEAAVFDPDRSLLYEFGGARAIASSLASDGLQAKTTPFTTQDPDTLVDTPLLDSSGSIPDKPLQWDSYEGELFSDQLQVPTNGFWTFSDGFVKPNESTTSHAVSFLRAWRVYSVSLKDIVLVQEQRLPL
mmetsp:Transcript_23017/g.31547  ORF Transcript_23017/g.31547 Transcript_23017/m.31547 type:complete len:558 (+) Transcript_23017:942-2615(+)